MKIRLDENMPARLAERLFAAGHDTDTVQHEDLSGQPDDNVWQAAQNAGRFLITQDLDFSDLRKYQPGKHHGLLLVRLANPSRRALIERVSTLFATEDVKGGGDVLLSPQNGRSGYGGHDLCVGYIDSRGDDFAESFKLGAVLTKRFEDKLPGRFVMVQPSRVRISRRVPAI